MNNLCKNDIIIIILVIVVVYLLYRDSCRSSLEKFETIDSTSLVGLANMAKQINSGLPLELPNGIKIPATTSTGNWNAIQIGNWSLFQSPDPSDVSALQIRKNDGSYGIFYKRADVVGYWPGP